MKFYQLVWTGLFILFFSACHKNLFNKNPLKDIPSELQQGVLETGPEQFSKLDDFIVEKSLKINLNNKLDTHLKFQEGVEKVYHIQLDLVSGFDKNYEILYLENPFSDLIGSEWSYNPKTKTGELKWTPEKTFNKGDFYKILTVRFPVTLRKKSYSQKTSLLTIPKTLNVLIYKNFYPIEITAIRTWYNSYIKLEDNLFYEDTQIHSLNLNYYDSFFRKIEGEERDPELPPEELNPQFIFKEPIFKVVDKKGRPVPSVFSYFRESYYELVNDLTNKECVAVKDKYSCWIPLSHPENIPFKKQVYIKNYMIPDHLDKTQLYYKISSAVECDIYNQSIEDPIFKKSFKKSEGQWCYFPFSNLDIDDINSKFVSDLNSVYLLKKEGFQELDVKEWEVFFQEIPLFIQVQMSGHLPVENINISYLSEQNRSVNKVFFTIKDENYLSFHPDLSFENLMEEQVYSLLPFQFSRLSFVKVDPFLFEVEFSLEVEPHEEWMQYPLKVSPIVGFLKGPSVPIQVSVFPSILKEKEYYFEPSLDLKTEYWQKENQWAKTDMSLKTQVKSRYIFPKTVQDNLNLFHLDLDYFKEVVSSKEIKVLGHICNLDRKIDFLEERDCFCSNYSFYQDKEENIYMESTCHYSVKFQIRPSHVENNSSVYIQYNPRLQSDSLALPNSEDRKGSFSITEKSYLISQNTDPSEDFIKKEITDTEKIIHLFFNLKPSWKCETSFSDLGKNTCNITYSFSKLMISIYNDEMRDFLRSHISVETKCFRSDGTQFLCDCGVINASDKNNLEFQCGFSSKDVVSFQFRLKTEHPLMYFFNAGEEKENKKTPFEKITIE